jgi:hypothetical protein
MWVEKRTASAGIAAGAERPHTQCHAVTPYGDGDLGTPALSNDCSL